MFFTTPKFPCYCFSRTSYNYETVIGFLNVVKKCPKMCYLASQSTPFSLVSKYCFTIMIIS